MEQRRKQSKVQESDDDVTLASFPGPAQLSIASKWGEGLVSFLT